MCLGSRDGGVLVWFLLPHPGPQLFHQSSLLCEDDEHGCYETGTNRTAGGISNGVGVARDGSMGDVFGDGGNDRGVMRLQISIAGHGPSALLMSLFASS